MTVAPHTSEVHRLIDQLAPAQVEALYVLLHSMAGHAGEGEVADVPGGEADIVSPGAAPQDRFPFIGIMDGPPDLAARSAQILRDELGDPGT